MGAGPRPHGLAARGRRPARRRPAAPRRSAAGFADEDELLQALHGVWSRRLNGRIDLALETDDHALAEMRRPRLAGHRRRPAGRTPGARRARRAAGTPAAAQRPSTAPSRWPPGWRPSTTRATVSARDRCPVRRRAAPSSDRAPSPGCPWWPQTDRRESWCRTRPRPARPHGPSHRVEPPAARGPQRDRGPDRVAGDERRVEDVGLHARASPRC